MLTLRSTIATALLLTVLMLIDLPLVVIAFKFRTLESDISKFLSSSPPLYTIERANAAALNAALFLVHDRELQKSRWIVFDATNGKFGRKRFAPMLNIDLSLQTISGPDGLVPNMDLVFFETFSGAFRPASIVRPRFAIDTRNRKYVVFDTIHTFTSPEKTALRETLSQIPFNSQDGSSHLRLGTGTTESEERSVGDPINPGLDPQSLVPNSHDQMLGFDLDWLKEVLDAGPSAFYILSREKVKQINQALKAKENGGELEQDFRAIKRLRIQPPLTSSPVYNRIFGQPNPQSQD